MSDRLEAAVDAAFAASNAWGNRSRQVVFVSPSKDQVRATIRAEFDRAEEAEAKLARLLEEVTALRALALTNGIPLADLERIRDVAHAGEDGTEEETRDA